MSTSIDVGFDELIKRHEAAIVGAIEDEKIRKEVSSEINQRLCELKNALIGVCYLGELTNRSLAYIYSFGERMSVPILSGSLRDLGIKSKSFSGGEAGVTPTASTRAPGRTPSRKRRSRKSYCHC